jgi:uncharacterized protein (TIRG00374 family)
MDKKRILITGIAVAILAGLVYVQVRHWKTFDWATFLAETKHISLLHILHAIALIYVAYLMRAIRWKIFLRPVRPKASYMSLVGPTVVGFTGLALLGRPGEFIRPYLIARRQNLPVSSQVAAWAVERIFDVGAFATLMALAIFLPSAMSAIPHPEYFSRFREAGFALLAIVLGLACGAMVVARMGNRVADWVEKEFAHLSANLGHRIGQKIREFTVGLKTIHGPVSLLALVVVSLAMWYIIALAYQETMHSYGVAALEIPVSQILLVMGSSMIGSMVQLPGVGGGSQLATIATLNHVFDVPPELAASCGILLWLVTFFAIVPVGLALARHEHLSLRKLSEESHQAEEAALAAPAPPGV